MAIVARSIVWIDGNGFSTQTVVGSDPDASAIQSALKGHSNADVLNWFEGAQHLNTTPVTSLTTYFTVSDLARLLFLDTAGSIVTLNLPAPQLSVFEADQVTVKASAIADIIAAFIASGRSAADLPITSFVAGNLLRRKSFG